MLEYPLGLPPGPRRELGPQHYQPLTIEGFRFKPELWACPDEAQSMIFPPSGTMGLGTFGRLTCDATAVVRQMENGSAAVYVSHFHVERVDDHLSTLEQFMQQELPSPVTKTSTVCMTLREEITARHRLLAGIGDLTGVRPVHWTLTFDKADKLLPQMGASRQSELFVLQGERGGVHRRLISQPATKNRLIL